MGCDAEAFFPRTGWFAAGGLILLVHILGLILRLLLFNAFDLFK